MAERRKEYGFKASVGRLNEPDDISEGGLKYRYLVKIKLEEHKSQNADTARERFEHAKRMMEEKANSLGGRTKWSVLGVGGAKATHASMEEVEEAPPRPPFQPVDLTDELIEAFFPDVYGREPHLRIINDAVQTHVKTEGKLRAHTLLYGEPGGCKSTVYERLKPIYDDDVERMIFLDATTMSKAGFEKWVLEHSLRNMLPEILVIEEIEKVDNKDNLKALGSIMASGYLMRTNANIGRVQVPANFLVLATCNDTQVLQGFMHGFIWDRFVNQEHCPLPDEATMHRILLDKITLIPGGNPAWADAAMALAKRLGARSPRTVIGFLAGRHRLETGAYQRDKVAIRDAQRAEERELFSRAEQRVA